MKKKGKKKDKRSHHGHQIPQEHISSRESSPPYGDGDVPMNVRVGILNLEESIRALKEGRDTAIERIELLPLLESELKVLKAKIRDQKKKKEDEDEADSVNLAASVLESRFGAIFSDREREYYDDSRGFLETWRVLASEGRKEGSKSLIELLREIDRSDGEGTRVFVSMKETMIDVGIRISSLVAEYFSLFIGVLEDSEMAMRTRTIKNTVVIESVDEKDSPVIDRFVAVIESADRKIRVSEEDETREYELSFGERESRLLGSIFFKVLYLEVVFCFPSFPEKLENKDMLDIRDYIIKMFEEKLDKLSSEINEFKKECESVRELGSKVMELKEVLDSEIKEIWEILDLHQIN